MVEEIANLIKYLDENDDEYEKYLQFKRRDGFTNELLRDILSKRDWEIDNDWNKPYYIEGFECFVCKRLHENRQREKNGQASIHHEATLNHYGCPKPRRFSDKPPGNLTLVDSDWWASAWITAKYIAMATKESVIQGVLPKSEETFMDRVIDLYNKYEL